MTKSSATTEPSGDPAPAGKASGDPVPGAYATEAGETGKPVGPEHDGSFSAPDFYDPATGERIGTPWDSEAQKNDPGIGEPGESERPEKAAKK